MSSSTPNIGLTLPIGTEKVSRQIINDNMQKIDTAFGGIANGTMRPVPFAVAVADWSLSAGQYVAEFTTAYVTSTSNEFATFDTGSMKLYCKDIIDIAKKSGGGGMILTTETIPTGTISGMLYVWDTDDGKIPVIIEGTTVPIANGGTGASNLAGAKTNLGIEQCEQDIATLNSHIANIDGWNYIDFARGSNPVTYPATAKELLVITSWENSSFDYGYSINIPVTDCAVSHFRTGAYATSTNNGSVGVNIDRTNRQVNISSLYYNGTSYSNGYIAVYYK